jgi:hypothetical protein
MEPTPVRLAAPAPSPGPAPRPFAPVLRRAPSPSAAAPADAAPQVVHRVLGSAGQALDPSTRSFMEPRFGHSFADVRVHADGRAAESAAAVGARAYAVGRDVVFSAGAYAPASAAGRKLIAHELAHVVQQSGSASTTRSPSLEIGAVDAPEEREADAAARAVAAGGAARVAAAGGAALRRQGPEPTARQVRRDEQLRGMARWPGEGLEGWRGLSEGERSVVTLYMAMRYGDDFARAFLAIASNARARRRTRVVHYTNVIDETHDQLRARGFRLSMVSGNVEYWVRANGDELRRILPTQRSAPEPPAAEQPPPPQPQPQAPEPAESPARLPPRSTWGPAVRDRDGAQVMGSRGRAVQYRDGTIELDQGGGRTITYRPRPNSVGAYDFYGEDGNLVENVVIVIEPDEVFGGGGANP